MWVFGSVVVCVAIVSIAEAINEEEERNIRQLHTKRQLAKAYSENQASVASLLLSYMNLEERVQALELQMQNVHEDITLIEGEISETNSEQDLQDTQIQQIEKDINEIQGGLGVIGGTVTELTAVTDDLQLSLVLLQEKDAGLSEELSKLNTSVTMVTENVEGLTGITDDLQVSVVTLQETDADLMEDIAQLTEGDGTLDSRLSQLEVDGAVAFHAALGTYSHIRINTIVVFGTVNVNLGGGYSGSTGQFTTPSGGAGLYYFYVHVSLDRGTFAWTNIRHNGTTVAIMREDETRSRNYPSGSCGAVIMMQEGNNVR